MAREIHSGWAFAEKVCEALEIDPALVQRIVIDLDCCEPTPGKIFVQMVTPGTLLEIDWKGFCDEADVKIVGCEEKADPTPQPLGAVRKGLFDWLRGRGRVDE